MLAVHPESARPGPPMRCTGVVFATEQAPRAQGDIADIPLAE